MENKQAGLMPIVEAVRQVTGKEFHRVTVRRWRRENRIRGCVKVGKEWFCELARVQEMIDRDSVATADTKPST